MSLKCGENQKQPWAENTKYHKDLIILDFPISLCLWVQRKKIIWKALKIACCDVMVLLSEF